MSRSPHAAPLNSSWSFPEWGNNELAEHVLSLDSDISSALTLARSLSYLGPQIGSRTWQVFSALATIGSVDLSIARAVEPHLDAIAILDQAKTTSHPLGSEAPDATWGVYAASPPGTKVGATYDDGRWSLNGAKPWCSLADQVSHALMTASLDSGGQQLFAVSLRERGVAVSNSDWQALGLRNITTGTVTLADVTAEPVGPPGWYLERRGFSWGGVAVAAVWFGAAAALAGALWSAARHREPDQIALMHLGSCDAALHSALLVLRDAAEAIDNPTTTSAQAEVLASRTRSCVATVAEQVLATVEHALGPGPLAFNVPHLRRVADLTLYVRQHHAERDSARLGSLVAPPLETPQQSKAAS